MNDETYLTNLEKANLLRHRAGQLLRESEELLRQARELERLANFSSGEEVEKALRPMIRITHNDGRAKAEIH